MTPLLAQYACMSESIEKRSDLVILGLALIVLGFTLMEPRGGPFSWYLRGWLGVMGLCLIVRSLTVRKYRKADRILIRMLMAIGWLGLISAVGYVMIR